MPLWGSGLGNCFEIGQKGMRQAQELGSGHQILVVFLRHFRSGKGEKNGE